MTKVKITSLFLVLVFVLVSFTFVQGTVYASQGLILYTPYTGLSVTPGDTLRYSIEVINNTDSIQNVTFSLQGLPEGWNPSFTSGSKSVQKLAIKSKDFEEDNSRDIDLEVEVPLQIQKGDYNFKVIAKTGSGSEYVLPLTVTVTEKGVFKTELTADQTNMEGYSDSTFNYDLTLKNRTAEKQHYALTADAPRGWDVRFKVYGDYVTSVTLDSNESKSIDVYVNPSNNVKAGTYNITVEASSGTTSEQVNLEAVIKGKYDLKLSTPTGLLSTTITAGGEKSIKLQLENTGTVTLRDIKLDSSTPIDWNVEFDKEKITKLEPGEKATIDAKISASDKAIAGDYQLIIDANAPEASSSAVFRITVKTSVLWGWVGILIILIVIAVIYYFVRKYGRR